MGRQKKEIKAILCLPKSEHIIYQFEKRMGDFYAAQVERGLRPLPKEEKIEALDAIISSYGKHPKPL